MEDILPLWLYCCLTEARLAALASMAELERPGVPGVECRGEPDIEAEIGLEVTHKAGMGGSSSILLVIRQVSKG